VLVRELSKHGNCDAEKAIAGAVLATRRFEKASRAFGARPIRQGFQLTVNR
jgi:hypothetical protein